MGRPNKIESPERMWELFQEYKRYVKNNPILKHTFVGKEGRSEYSELERPLTCLLYTSPSPRDGLLSRMPSSA